MSSAHILHADENELVPYRAAPVRKRDLERGRNYFPIYQPLAWIIHGRIPTRRASEAIVTPWPRLRVGLVC